jgi:photosystem II stability/assembly factor-like uncharacterized protein
MNRIYKQISILLAIFSGLYQLSYSQWLETSGPSGVYRITGLTSDASHIYFGALRGGVYISTNNGDQWTNSALSNYLIYTVINIDGRLFASTWSSGLLFSDNFGMDWLTSNTDNMYNTIRTIYKQGGNLFAGLYGDGVFVSRDNGVNWRPINSGLTETYVLSLAAIGDNIYAGTTGGVFKFNAISEEWTNIACPSNWANALLAKGNRLIVGTLGVLIYNSLDGTWSDKSSGIENINVSSLCADSTRLYAGTESGGVFYSEDEGQTWYEMNAGLTDLNVLAIYFNGARLFVGTEYGGVYRFDYGQNKWQHSITGVSGTTVISFGSDLGCIYAGTENNGIYKMEDGGSSWIQKNSGLTFMNIHALIVHDGNVYAGTFQGGVFVSPDRGETWESICTGLSDLNIIDFAVNGASLFAATSNGIFMYKKSSKSWIETSTYLTNKIVHSLLVLGERLFAGTANGIFKQNNTDKSWVEISDGMTNKNVKDIVACGSNIIALTDGGLFILRDNGNTWENVNSTLNNIQALAAKDQFLFASTTLFGIYMSDDYGVSWRWIGDMMTTGQITSLAVHGSELFVGTWTGPVWRRSLSDLISDVSERNILKPTLFKMVQNYPNPFNCETTVAFHVSLKSFVSIDVWNSVGRRVSTIAEKEFLCGDHTYVWNAEKMPSGLYFIRLRIGSKNFVIKSVLIK